MPIGIEIISGRYVKNYNNNMSILIWLFGNVFDVCSGDGADVSGNTYYSNGWTSDTTTV